MRNAFWRVLESWTVGEYDIHMCVWHKDGSITYTWSINGKLSNESVLSLDKALLSAVAEKHTGERGASGTGVGTAADWMARAIGLDD